MSTKNVTILRLHIKNRYFLSSCCYCHRMMDETKQFLIDVDYPHVSALSDDEIVNLFDAENLPGFLRWFVGELLSDTEMAASYKDSEIVDIICTFGYCSKKQKEGFSKGSLDFEQQFEIIYRMLSSLSNIKKSESRDGETFEMVTLEEFNELVTKKLDFLSSLSGKKGYTDYEREEHVTTLQEQIKELDDRIGTLETQVDNDETDGLEKDTLCSNQEEKEKVDLPSAIDQFLFSTSKVSEIQCNIEKSSEIKEISKFSEEFSSKLIDCCDDTLGLEEYFTNLSILDDYNAINSPIEIKEPSECASAVEKLLKLAEQL